MQNTETKFTRIYVEEETGIRHTWTYNLDIDKVGPISVDIHYPKNYEDTPAVNDTFSGIENCIKNVKVVSTREINKQLKKKKLLKSEQRYINPLNGKEVGYTRAKALGLI